MKQKFKLYLGVGVSNWNEGQYNLTGYNPEKGSIEHRSEALVREVEVEIDVPEKVDLNALKLKALEDQLAQDKVDTHVRQNILLDQISKLKCVSHDDALEG